MTISITSFTRNSCETHMCKGNTVFKDMYLLMYAPAPITVGHSQLPISFYIGYGRHMQAMCESIDKDVHVCSYTLIFMHTKSSHCPETPS